MAPRYSQYPRIYFYFNVIAVNCHLLDLCLLTFSALRPLLQNTNPSHQPLTHQTAFSDSGLLNGFVLVLAWHIGYVRLN